jgi:hypothetical protein
MMFYKQGGSDDFMRHSGMDMRKLSGASLGYTLPTEIQGPKDKTEDEIAAENLANYLFWLKPPAPPKPDKDQPFGTANYTTIMLTLKQAAQTFASLFAKGAMTTKQYTDAAAQYRGTQGTFASGGQMVAKEWTVQSAKAFLAFLQGKLALSITKVTQTIAPSIDLDKAAKEWSDKLKASLQPWAAMAAKWLGTTPSEFAARVDSYTDNGILYAEGAAKVKAYIEKAVADAAIEPQGHTAEKLAKAGDLRDELEKYDPKHKWLTNEGWSELVKSFKGTGSWTFAAAKGLLDAVQAELTKLKGAKAAALAAAATAQSKTAQNVATLKVLAAANQQKIKALLTDANDLFQKLQSLSGMTADEYNTLAVSSGMNPDTKLWTVEAATKFRDALQKKFHDVSQSKLDADAKKAADDASIKKILADTDAYFATQSSKLAKTQADYDAMKAAAKGAGDWTVASATAFQAAVYALPLVVSTPAPVVTTTTTTTYGGGGGGGGGGGSSTGFGEGMALFTPPIETPATLPPVAPVAAEKKSALPVLALIGAAALALFRK